jgi:hypothetical protein
MMCCLTFLPHFLLALRVNSRISSALLCVACVGVISAHSPLPSAALAMAFNRDFLALGKSEEARNSTFPAVTDRCSLPDLAGSCLSE